MATHRTNVHSSAAAGSFVIKSLGFPIPRPDGVRANEGSRGSVALMAAGSDILSVSASFLADSENL